MTPAELKTLRESLGLSAQWVADRSGVQLRTVQYWESGRSAVPADVAEMLVEIDRRLQSAVAMATQQIDAAITERGEPQDVVLVRYRTDEDLWRFRPDMLPLPATTHAALLDRLRRATDAFGVRCRIQFMDPQAYAEWLHGREDSESERAAWAATLPREGPRGNRPGEP